MNEKDLRRLSRRDLLELLLEQMNRIEELEKEVKSLNTKLNNKKISIKESGTLAEASLKIGGMFEACEESINIYKKNLEDKYNKEFEKNNNDKLKELDNYCDKKKEESKKLLEESRIKYADIIKEAKEKADKILEKAKESKKKLDTKEETKKSVTKEITVKKEKKKKEVEKELKGTKNVKERKERKK